MMTLTLMLLAGAFCAVALLSAVATRDIGYAPVTVNPFAAPPLADPGADTIANTSADPTLGGDWHRAELTSLSDAEDLLDYLEMTNARDRSLEVAGNSTFVIRWR